MKKRILSIFGTRPEAIKMAPVVSELKKVSEKIDSAVCVTAQHREMLDQVLKLFNIKPDFDLDIMEEGQDLFDITSKVLLGLREVIRQFKPHIILVHGDTTTSFAAALAGFYEGVKVGHVEAGLRTYNLELPWPEEGNRQLTDRIASFHFAPSENAKKCLLNEHIESRNIVVTGNTVIDALLDVVNKFDTDAENIINNIATSGYRISEREYILITGHRRENLGQGFLDICDAIKTLALKYPDMDFIYPVHLNPKVRTPVNDILHEIKNVNLIEPLEYVPFIYLMSKSYLILTDSGGIQEEAPSLGKPVIVMRDMTERTEAVDAGTVILVGTDKEKIVNKTSELIEDNTLYKTVSQAHNPYGDGAAAKKIVHYLLNNLE